MKLAIFDLDGVLARTDHLHTFAFKEAITHYAPEAASASYLGAHDGVRTKDKLIRLQTDYHLTDELIVKIDKRKQSLTEQHLRHIRPNNIITQCLQTLKAAGWTVALASNSRKKNVDIITDALKIDQYLSLKITGDAVVKPKPHPEIFHHVIEHFNADFNNVFIFEDSAAGIEAAIASGAHVIKVDPNTLVTLDQVLRILSY